MTELAEYTHERDRIEFSLGDTLDIKTGLILACLTFLAIQSADLIKTGLSALPLQQAVAQVISIMCLVAGGALSVWVLWPRNYIREAPPEKYERWIADTDKFRQSNPSAEPFTEDKLRSARLSAAMERLRVNSAINKTKSNLMFGAFYCLTVSFAANIITLVMRLF